MADFFILPEVEDENEWINYLPKYQEKLINQLLKDYTVEEAGSIWIDSTIDTNSPFSTKGNRNKYYQLVFNEIKKLICGDEKYQKERNQLAEVGKGTLVTTVANMISGFLGLPAELIAGTVATIFVSISKVSTSAWCEMNQAEG